MSVLFYLTVLLRGGQLKKDPKNCRTSKEFHEALEKRRGCLKPRLEVVSAVNRFILVLHPTRTRKELTLQDHRPTTATSSRAYP